MDHKWNSGPPPSFGWWPASSHRMHGTVSWWDGVGWSAMAKSGQSLREVEKAARFKLNPMWNHVIEWQDRPKTWPERSKT